jgi:thymidine phosphorylase
MLFLGGKAESPQAGQLKASAALHDGSAERVFLQMVEAQGGDISVFEKMHSFHRPGARLEVPAWESGFIAKMDTTMLGWAVQRLGAGRVRASEPLDPHAGIEFHAHRGDWVEQGQPLATLYATRPGLFSEPEGLLRSAIRFSPLQPKPVELVSRVWTRTNAEAHLRNALR